MQNDGMLAEKEQELVLPMVPQGSVEVFNAFYRRRAPMHAVLAGRRLTIEPSWSATDEHTTGRTIHLDIDGEDGELKVPQTLLDLLMASVDDAPPLDSLAPEHAAMVVEYALSEPLHAMETRLGCHIEIVSLSGAGGAREDARPPLSFALSIDGTGTSWSELRLFPGQAIQLSQHLDRSAGRLPASNLDLPFTMSLRLASVKLTAGEAASLSPGDVVLTDEICEPGSAVLVIAEHLGALAALTDDGPQLASSPGPLRGSAWEWAMDRVTQATPRDAGDAGGVDGIPIRLMFELGRTEIALSKFGELTPGRPLPFALATDGTLGIFAGGKRIGKGVLIQIGASLGVRITRLAGKTGQ